MHFRAHPPVFFAVIYLGVQIVVIETCRRHVPARCSCYLERLPEVEVAVCHY